MKFPLYTHKKSYRSHWITIYGWLNPQQLRSEEALKVMGFTSELRFLAGPVYRGEAELEVRTRTWALRGGWGAWVGDVA